MAGDLPQESGERMVQVGGVELCVETFGQKAEPAVLLIMGAASSMLAWEEELCERLAAGPRFVIRYDHRDTGRSVTYAPGAPEYTGADLVADAAGLLDALGVSRAHVVGMSMGGGLAQELALDHPDRVASLTLISTSPVSGGDLPGSSDELRAYFADPLPSPDWSDRQAVIDYLVEDERHYAARSRPFDEQARRELAGRVFDRSIDLEASMTNHFLLGGGEGARALGQVRLPTLVLHGTEDPLFPVAHAEALAREIPGAQLVLVERMGHELPRRAWDELVAAILQHTTSG
jgi:pimeloyl-ACP methyl ester carboxylesterase